VTVKVLLSVSTAVEPPADEVIDVEVATDGVVLATHPTVVKDEDVELAVFPVPSRETAT